MNPTITNYDDPSFDEYWDGISSPQIERNALYLPGSGRFYEEIRTAKFLKDMSFIVCEAGSAVFGLKAILYEMEDGSHEVSWNGLAVVFGCNETVSRQQKAACWKVFKSELKSKLNAVNGCGIFISSDFLMNGCPNELTLMALEFGASCQPSFTQVIDLTEDEAELRKPLTKTVKWSLNWGFKNLEIVVKDKSNTNWADVQAFRDLHESASGRQTRSRESWVKQFEMVQSGEGFFVLGYRSGELVSATYFIFSSSHCYYGVSASQRSLFDKPISHALVWTALLHAKSELKISYFEMGEQVFEGVGSVRPTKKELGISFFKRSFGGLSEARLNTRLRLPLQ